MNPLFEHTTQPENANMQSVKRMYKMYKNAQNPQQAIMMVAQRNPMIAQIMQASGGDLKGLFYAKCNEMGVNPDDILKQLN